MIARFVRDERGCLVPAGDKPGPFVWVDLDRPSDAERAEIEASCGIAIPRPDALNRAETSDQLYREGNANYMIVSTVVHTSGPLTHRSYVAFIATAGHVVTVHYGPPRGQTALFADFVRLAGRDPSVTADQGTLIASLVDSLVERMSRLLERLEHEIEQMTLQAFGDDEVNAKVRFERTREFRMLLRRIGRKGNAVAKIRQGLHSTGRMLAYLAVSDLAAATPSARARCQELQNDVRGLQDLAGSISQNVGFLLDASLGMITIEQNLIIKLFTVISAAFLPPTLIGTLYGMNFELMPELKWPLGYPLALGLMVVSAALPLIWFHRKGWF